MPTSGSRRAHKISKERATMSDLVGVTTNGDIAIITINNPPVNALSPGVPEGIGDAIDQIAKDSQRESGCSDWRWENVYRRRGYQRIREDDVRKNRTRRRASSATSQDRKFDEACSGRDSRHRFRWRARDCDVRALPGCIVRCSGGAAGSQAWHHSRRSRHATFTSAGRCREGCRDVRGRQACKGAATR